MADSPELIDYIAFFEAEPEILNPELGWCFGAKFVSIRGDNRIVAVIAPSCGKFSFMCWQSQNLLADLNLSSIVDWKLDRNSDKRVLFLEFNQPEIGFFSLQLKPEISFTWLT
jgi:hypothetical protein